MIEKLEEMKELRPPISQSAIITALRCPRCFLYRYRWGLVPKIERYARAATIGSLFHRLMHVGEGRIVTVQREVADQQNELMARIQKGEDLTGDLARTAQGLTELYNKALVMARIFWKRFPCPDYLETMAAEKTIEMALSSFPGITIKGRLDKIVRDTRDGVMWIRDSKTTSRDIAYTLTGYMFSIQCRLYRLLAIDYVPKGFILDIARVPSIKFCNKDKDFDAYLIRVEKWYEEQEELGVTPMTSKAIIFSEPLMNDELTNVLATAIGLANKKMMPNNFSRDVTTSYCKDYNKVCPYYDLCNSDEAGWPSLINRLYDVVDSPITEEQQQERISENE